MDITVTFVGNATTLISAGGLTLLTDPNFLHRWQHAYLGYGLVSKRLREPALNIDELPIVTTPHAAKRLHHSGFGHALGLSTWQRHTITKGGNTVHLTSLPGRHAPLWSHRLLPPVMGTMLEFVAADRSVRRLYVSGDTLLVEELDEISVRFDAIDAGVLHLGATRLPAGRRLPFGLTVTMDGRQGAELVAKLALPKMITVHFDEYGVFASPPADFVAAMKRRGMGDRIIELDRGATATL